jgi:glutamine amidotransferase
LEILLILVIDYNVGNVKSVCNALAHIGCEAELSSEPERIVKADGIILPGVAAFGYAMSQLGPTAELIKEAVVAGKVLLGICVGHQLLFEQSSEHGRHKGLGLISGNVQPLPSEHIVPHMGWNVVTLPAEMELFKGLRNEEYFYFAHSYYAEPTDSGTYVAYTDYGFKLPAAVQKENVYGVQFHPEKSGEVGLNVLRNFEKICRKAG